MWRGRSTRACLGALQPNLARGLRHVDDATGGSRASFALFVAWDGTGTDFTRTVRVGYIYNEITRDEA